MTASKIFFWFCLAFLAGLAIESFFRVPRLFLLGIFFLATFLIIASVGIKAAERTSPEGGSSIAGIFLTSLFWKQKGAVIFGFAIIFLAFGIFRHQMAESEITKNDLAKFNDINSSIVLYGKIIEDPVIGEKTTKLIIETERITISNETTEISSSKILVFAKRYPEYQYGDRITIRGLLKSPPVLEGFNYPEYLQKEGIYSVIEWPQIEIAGQNEGNFLMKILFSFKNNFKKTSQQFIPLPQEGFLEALVFGDETNISKEWKDKLNITGTRHIAAVSGMNITIIAFLILNFLLILGFWRKHAFLFTIIILFLYILMIGAPSSAVRAGIMGGLLIIAQSLGRMSLAARAVIFAAFFMLILNPLLLRFDVGFQLSFLALLGLIYLQPFLSDILKKIPDFKIFPVRTTLSATLAAQIFTLPVLIFNFGYICLVSVVANILIVPILAFLTILIFIFVASAMVFWPLGWILSLPVHLFLSYIIRIIDFFSKIPFTVIKIENIPWIFLLLFYLALGFLVIKIQERQKLRFLKI